MTVLLLIVEHYKHWRPLYQWWSLLYGYRKWRNEIMVVNDSMSFECVSKFQNNLSLKSEFANASPNLETSHLRSLMSIPHLKDHLRWRIFYKFSPSDNTLFIEMKFGTFVDNHSAIWLLLSHLDIASNDSSPW